MCGITVCVRRSTSGKDVSLEKIDAFWHQLTEANAVRGPDSQRGEDINLPGPREGNDLRISIFASTLHLRGATIASQPHTSDKSIFCWNGQVFEGLDIPAESNDGTILFAALDASEQPEDVRMTLSKIEGPYAFIFYQRTTHRLFFARDPLGRRSLLIHRPNSSNPCLFLSSVSADLRFDCNFEEVDPRHIHCLDLDRLRTSENTANAFDDAIISLERTRPQQPTLFGKLAHVNRTIPGAPPMISLSNPLPDELAVAIDQFMDTLDHSVRLRVQNIPVLSHHPQMARVAVLYSGGIDCTIVAFLASRHIPLDEPIDLLNVAFENPRKMRSLNPDHQMKPKKRKLDLTKQGPPILDRDVIYNVPDRVGGIEELEELRQLCPGRQWNFVEINVDYAESSSMRKMIEAIMLPNRTVMDLSLALALYFASRGVGNVRKSPTDPPQPYTSRARVLLSGLGSDELLGGYSRHRSAFNAGSWQGLIDELQLELDRLPSRNLGRDDRMISAHGKETRHPFLSLSVVDFVASLPVHLKVDPRLEVGLGDKMLLRLAAQKLGLEMAGRRKKRAMQFGSHSAKMEVGVGDRDGDTDLALVGDSYPK